MLNHFGDIRDVKRPNFVGDTVFNDPEDTDRVGRAEMGSIIYRSRHNC